MVAKLPSVFKKRWKFHYTNNRLTIGQICKAKGVNKILTKICLQSSNICKVDMDMALCHEWKIPFVVKKVSHLLNSFLSSLKSSNVRNQVFWHSFQVNNFNFFKFLGKVLKSSISWSHTRKCIIVFWTIISQSQWRMYGPLKLLSFWHETTSSLLPVFLSTFYILLLQVRKHQLV